MIFEIEGHGTVWLVRSLLGSRSAQMKSINFTRPGPLLTQVDLHLAEQYMGFRLPAGLRSLYFRLNGGAPDCSYFTNTENTWWFDWMHPIAVTNEEGASNSLQRVYRQMVGEGFIPSRCLPFGIDPGGNFFLLDVDTDKVWYMPMDVWDRDLSAEQNWREDGRDLAISFESFMDGLTKDSPF